MIWGYHYFRKYPYVYVCMCTAYLFFDVYPIPSAKIRNGERGVESAPIYNILFVYTNSITLSLYLCMYMFMLSLNI